jgi:hypothetical protein
MSGGRSARPGRDALILAISAGVLVAASAAGHRLLPSQPSAAPGASLGPPSPLPSGALMRPPAVPIPEVSCSFEDRGFGDYEPWRNLRMGRVLLPRGRGLDEDGGFWLLWHFHGAEAVRKQVAPEGMNLVLAAHDAGTLSSHYSEAVPPPTTLAELTRNVESVVAEATGVPNAHAKHVAASSWSAGYGAIAELVRRPHEQLEALVLLDSLHATYAPGGQTIVPQQLAPFLAVAHAAAEGGPLFYLTHGEIRPGTYASTAEVGAFLLQNVGGERGRLFVRGYPGDTKDAHCAHLRLLVPILREHVLPSWR